MSTRDDLGRAQGVGHEHGRVVAPRDDVDLLARQLGDDRLDARAALADRGADRVETLLAEATATLERLPASRAMALISTVPLWISGTSSSNRRLRKPLWVRLTKICGPAVERRTSSTNALTFWPMR